MCGDVLAAVFGGLGCNLRHRHVDTVSVVGKGSLGSKETHQRALSEALWLNFEPSALQLADTWDKEL